MTAMPSETPAVATVPSALAKAQLGDHEAFAQLVTDHEAMVFSLIYRFFGDRSRAEELAQDVFLQLYRNLSSIESDAHLLFWLRQVATRRCIDVSRRTRFRVVSLEDAAEVPAHQHVADPLLDRRLRKLVEELPEAQKAVLTLRYQEDLDPSEICRIVGIPVNTVKSHLHRALQALRRKLENHP
jgi:RNA polymerase sigma-70 factor, ECF subfamily